LGSNEAAAKGQDLAALVGKSKPQAMTQGAYNTIEKRITKYAQEASTTEVRLAYAHALSVLKEYLITETNE
jgi:hypothetical protein